MSMPALVIHTPQYRVADGERSFEQVLNTGVGVGYALTSNMSSLPSGTAVVLLRKDTRRRRAEGKLIKLVPTGQVTRNGRRRYDVHVRDLKIVEYKPESLDRFGVQMIYL